MRDLCCFSLLIDFVCSLFAGTDLEVSRTDVSKIGGENRSSQSIGMRTSQDVSCFSFSLFLCSEKRMQPESVRQPVDVCSSEHCAI